MVDLIVNDIVYLGLSIVFYLFVGECETTVKTEKIKNQIQWMKVYPKSNIYLLKWKKVLNKLFKT